MERDEYKELLKAVEGLKRSDEKTRARLYGKIEALPVRWGKVAVKPVIQVDK
jgi:hypothetical protein